MSIIEMDTGFTRCSPVAKQFLARNAQWFQCFLHA